jgi:hypothetical protein
MKTKIIILILACTVIGIGLYSFTGQSQYDKLAGSFNNLSGDEQGYVRRELIEKLKADMAFRAYEKLCNEQYKISLESVGKTTSTTTMEDLKQKFRSPKELTSYYQKAGITQPEKYGQLELLKMLMLGTLAKKYPELKEMPQNDVAIVLTSARTPLKVSEKLNNQAILEKALRERHKGN